MRDFINCPRAYFLRQIYKDPVSRKKINLINPALALGNTVHDVLDESSVLPVEQRVERDLFERYEKAWRRVTGALGGFADVEEEFKQRVDAVREHPLEVVDVVVTRLPHLGRLEVHHADHEHVLVMRAVHHGHAAFLRQRLLDAP